MDMRQAVLNLWKDIDRQAWDEIGSYFGKDAVIQWPNTNERFTVNEFVRANSEYLGDWAITVEKLLVIDNEVVSVVKVSLKGDGVSFHATSFFTFADGKIVHLDEYWGSDDEPPQWRVKMGIGVPIIQV